LFTNSPASGFEVNTSYGIKRTEVNDENYTMLDEDHLIAYATIAVPRSVYLLDAVGRAGRVIIVKDETGTASGNAITIYPYGDGYVDGVTSYAISTDYGGVTMYCNGVNWFAIK